MKNITLTRPRTRKATMDTLNHLGIRFSDCDRVKLIHRATGEMLYGWQYDCYDIPKPVLDKLKQYNNVILGKHKHKYAPELSNPLVFLADKNIPLECRAIV